MSCPSCGSGNDVEFAVEMIIHFRSLENLDKPDVWVFSKIRVCLDCGFSNFVVRETELALLAGDTAPKRASAP
jgi:hypothetical protein